MVGEWCAWWSVEADSERGRPVDGVPLAGQERVYWPRPEWGLPVYPSAAAARITHFLISIQGLLQQRGPPAVRTPGEAAHKARSGPGRAVTPEIVGLEGSVHAVRACFIETMSPVSCAGF